MNGQVQQVEEGIKELLRCCPEWKERAEFLCSVPGVWPMLCATVIARLPQLGQLNRKEIAALAGLAPFNRDSGTLRGSARCAGHAPVPPPWPLPSSPEPAGGWRTIVPARGASAPGSSAAQILDSHLPLFQRPVYLPHAHHHPSQLLRPAYIVHPQIYPMSIHKSTLSLCAFHLGFGLAAGSRSAHPLGGFGLQILLLTWPEMRKVHLRAFARLLGGDSLERMSSCW